LNNNPIETKY